ncbi:Myb-like DNA-binding domain containing protein [Tritrichomonas foetus]|uniref:Myb-like DNA-binding domain containing protein n=1 Tax=Tritrichomonas foetus TaxID=1144522 RepID=A0A1J4KRN3_9EUKA|nr:Myb-like DNA-binding domain containing protein [Tritrichomonas foetus]|eukprot:OHT12326.1 Myb-like DNA-binding domain containing protein [Tritrichomonas foetus]
MLAQRNAVGRSKVIFEPLEQDVVSPEPSKKITMEDIMPLLSITNLQEDSQINEYIINNLKNIAKHKIIRINQAIEAIREKWPNATPLEIWVGYDIAGNCSDDLLLKLDEQGFTDEVKEQLKRRLSRQPLEKDDKKKDNEDMEDDSEDDDNGDDDGEFQVAFVPQPKKQVKYHRRFSKNNPVSSEPIPPAPKGVSEEEWRSWSDIHRKSFLCGMKDPNTFLYRNCPHGVQRKNGPWSEEEKRLFLKRLHEIRGDKDTIDGKWGIFSLGVPGRVGYQCSNFYRLLISNGEVHDSRYVIGEDGKLHHTSHMHPERQNAVSAPTKKKSKVPMRTFSIKSVTSLKFVFSATNKSEQADEDNEEIQPTRILGRYERWALQNPLPDAVDQITNELIKVPTLSPDGYVLDYNTWLNIIKDKSENPFTRNHVNRRDLIVLTIENIEKYRGSIVNL